MKIWIVWIKRYPNFFLYLWFRASLIYINNCPTRCNTKQSIYYSASSLYMFRVSTTPIIRSTQNCNYSLRYCAATSLQRGQASMASLTTLEGGSCTKRYDQSIYYSASSLYMFRVPITPIIRSTQYFNCSPRYCAAISLQRGQASLATLEGGSCTKNMTSTGGCSYSFVYSWWWLWLTPETCRMNLQNNK